MEKSQETGLIIYERKGEKVFLRDKVGQRVICERGEGTVSTGTSRQTECIHQSIQGTEWTHERKEGVSAYPRKEQGPSRDGERS